jgi:hypothetical protein
MVVVEDLAVVVAVMDLIVEAQELRGKEIMEERAADSTMVLVVEAVKTQLVEMAEWVLQEMEALVLNGWTEIITLAVAVVHKYLDQRARVELEEVVHLMLPVQPTQVVAVAHSKMVVLVL